MIDLSVDARQTREFRHLFLKPGESAPAEQKCQSDQGERFAHCDQPGGTKHAARALARMSTAIGTRAVAKARTWARRSASAAAPERCNSPAQPALPIRFDQCRGGKKEWIWRNLMFSLLPD